MKRLEGKVIVVVGGTTGLGLVAAEAFVEAGAAVVVVGRNAESARAAEMQLGERGRAHVADATDPATAVAAIQLARQRFGPLSGLYHVAGGSGRRFGDGPLDEVTDEGIDVTLDLNLKSVLYSNRAAVRVFREQGNGGSILNMSSVLGSHPAAKYFATHVYAAAKAGIVGFSRSVAARYASDGIRVNVIAPALVETPMAQRAAHDEEILGYIRTKQPLDGGRIGHPEDVTGAALFFLGDESRFVTGQCLQVDGGWSVSEGQYRV